MKTNQLNRHLGKLAIGLSSATLLAFFSQQANADTYTVQYGDSFYAIATKYGMSPYDLAAKNGKTIYEIGREIISNEKYKEIFENFPEIDITISAYISDKNLRVKMPNESEEWTSDEVKEYFTENEVYIQFYDYYKKVNIIKKTEFFVSEVNEVFDRDVEKEENEFILYTRLEIDGEIVRLNEYLAKNRLNLLKVLVKEKYIENEYY